MIGHLGIYHDPKKSAVVLRPIKHLTTDLRDRRLVARWSRLTRRWMRRG